MSIAGPRTSSPRIGTSALTPGFSPVPMTVPLPSPFPLTPSHHDIYQQLVQESRRHTESENTKGERGDREQREKEERRDEEQGRDTIEKCRRLWMWSSVATDQIIAKQFCQEVCL